MIPLSPEKLFSFFGLPVTDTLTATLLTDFVIVVLIFFVYRSISLYPGKLQSIVEMLIEYFWATTEAIAGPRTGAIFPWVMSIFIFIVLSNLMGLIPGYGLMEVVEEGKKIPIFRAATSDLNVTLGIALVSVVMTQVLSVKFIGVKNYLSRFFSLKMFGVFLLVGMIELVSEFVRIVSLSFRLLGNIFAGEVLLGTISGFHALTAFIVPIPFILLEVLVAVIQAIIFSMLTMAFMAIATQDTSH